MILGQRYRLIEPIGHGGMAVVWRAHDQILRRTVAVKMLAPQLALDPDNLRLLRDEALAVAGLTHPHITSVYDYGHQHLDGSKQAYLVMELVEGVTLRQLLQDAPSGLEWKTAASITAQTAAALAAAHERGIVHRDVTPSNIMLTADGVKVLDFGICVLAGFDDGQDDELVGTVDYIAPERVTGRVVVTAACDVYALGMILYRCLSGSLPWDGDTLTQRLRSHVFTPPEALPPVAGLPAGVADLCLSCLAKDPADRPTAAELATQLGRWELPSPPAAPTAGEQERTQLLKIPADVPRPTERLPAGAASRLASSIRTMPPRRKASLSAGAVTVAALVGVLLLNTGSADQAGATESPTAACDITYEIRPAGAGDSAELTVATSRDHPAPWRLTFTAGDQAPLVGPSVDLRQTGREVAITGAAALHARESFTVSLTSAVNGSGTAPAQFVLDGTACQSNVRVFSEVPSPVVVEPPPANPAEPVRQPPEQTSGKGKADNKGKGKGKGG